MAPEKKSESIQQVERALWIDAEIRAGRFPNTRVVAERFECATRTAQRSFEFLRDRFGAPLVYIAASRGYTYEGRTFGLPAVALTEGEVVSLLLAERLGALYGGSPLGGTIGLALEKVASALTDHVTITIDELRERYSFEDALPSQIDVQTFRILESAVATRRRCHMAYFTQSRGEATERDVDPLHLRSFKGEWYVIAHCHLRARVLDFHLGRISSVRMLDATFEPPTDFDLGRYLESGFDMMRGTSHFDVVLEFDAFQARWIRERPPAHPSATFEEVRDGRLLVRMRVSNLDGVARYALQYGGRVKVIEPKELIAIVTEHARQILEAAERDQSMSGPEIYATPDGI